MSEELDIEAMKNALDEDCVLTMQTALLLIAEVERLRAQLLAGATPEGQRKESTLQRLTRCRAVLNMHGVLTKVENSNILLRIVGNYSEFLPAPPAPASGEKP